MLVKVGVYCLRGVNGHWACYDDDDAMACGTKGPDVFIDIDEEDYAMYPVWLQKVIDAEHPRQGKYRIGERVRIVRDDYRGKRSGIVIHYWLDANDGMPYQVRLTDGDAWNFAEVDLEFA